MLHLTNMAIEKEPRPVIYQITTFEAFEEQLQNKLVKVKELDDRVLYVNEIMDYTDIKILYDYDPNKFNFLRKGKLKY